MTSWLTSSIHNWRTCIRGSAISTTSHCTVAGPFTAPPRTASRSTARLIADNTGLANSLRRTIRYQPSHPRRSLLNIRRRWQLGVQLIPDEDQIECAVHERLVSHFVIEQGRSSAIIVFDDLLATTCQCQIILNATTDSGSRHGRMVLMAPNVSHKRPSSNSFIARWCRRETMIEPFRILFRLAAGNSVSSLGSYPDHTVLFARPPSVDCSARRSVL